MTLALASVIAASGARAQGVAMGSGPRPGIKPIQCKGRGIPQLEDITQKAGIRFTHSSAPENRYIVESMSGGVILVDYDRDGWPMVHGGGVCRLRWRRLSRFDGGELRGPGPEALARIRQRCDVQIYGD